MIEIIEVKTRRDAREFVNFPLRLYKGCPYFVPPIYADELKLVLSGGNTENAVSVFFLAEKDGVTAGRIQGIIERQHNEKQNKKQVRFTRFDSINDIEVARALFSAVEKWAFDRQMTEIVGPLGYSDLDREGLLVEGFEENSTFEEQYNYQYYPALMDELGFVKDADWVEFELSLPNEKNDKLSRVAERCLRANGLHVASADMSKRKYINKYRDGFFSCLEECYRKLYGTVPISKSAQDELISQFMLIVDKRFLVIICDKDEKVVAFGLCFPAIGDALKPSGGRLTPLALLRVLRAVNDPEVLDLGLVAVLPEYQMKGVNAVILDALMKMLEKGNVKRCETNLNLETNTAVMSQWKHFNKRMHKRRRCYIKEISV